MKLLGLLLITSLLPLAAGELQNERYWTGVNGKRIKGVYIGTVEGGTKVQIATPNGHLLTIALDNLSKGDRELIEHANAPAPAPAPATGKAGARAGFRTWTLPSGRPFEGRDVRQESNGGTTILVDPDGNEKRLWTHLLPETEQAWIRELVDAARATAGADRAAGTGAFAAFKPEPQVDRLRMPVINQSDFGQNSSDCVPSSFSNFVLWWDQVGYLEVPKRGDFEDKAEWVHTRMARYCRTRNTAGTHISKAINGFATYFEKELEGIAGMRFFQDCDLTPTNLTRRVAGSDATMLGITIHQPPGHDSAHWVALAEADEKGRLVFHTWGARLEGTMTVHEKSDKTVRLQELGTLNTQEVPATSYEIKISNPGDLPAWIKTHPTRFFLRPERYDGIFIVRPYRYKESDEPAPLPLDPDAGI